MTAIETLTPNRTAARTVKTLSAILMILVIGPMAMLTAQDEKPATTEETLNTDEVEVQSAKAQAPKKIQSHF
jgi:hypothetical protein